MEVNLFYPYRAGNPANSLFSTAVGSRAAGRPSVAASFAAREEIAW